MQSMLTQLMKCIQASEGDAATGLAVLQLADSLKQAGKWSSMLQLVSRIVPSEAAGSVTPDLDADSAARLIESLSNCCFKVCD